jgi:PBP1b-binding outer membrane lipoprotein LpoB
MNIQLLSTLLLSLFLLVGCSQGESTEGSDDQNETTTEETARPQEGNANGAATMPSASDVTVSDEELQKFVAMSQEMQAMSMDVQQDMIEAVESQGLDLQRFADMDKMDRNPKKELEGTPKEIEQYRAASQRVNEIQTEAQQMMREKLNEEGFTEQRLQQINMALQKDPNLQQRFRELQQAQMPAQQPAQQ